MREQAFDRRGWLRATIGVIATAIASVLGLVVGGAVVSPGLAGRREAWRPAGRLSDIAPGVPTPPRPLAELSARVEDGRVFVQL